jgi:hypothetical protein
MIKISMFILPQEIDLYENILIQLKKNQTSGVILEPWLCLSNTLTAWHLSKIPIEFFEKKFNGLTLLTDWCSEYRPHIVYDDDSVLGCVSQRRESSKTDLDIDAHMWLDCDMIFPTNFLKTVFASIEAIKENTPYYIITPEFVKIWDDTWDILVNEYYRQDSHDTNVNIDIYTAVRYCEEHNPDKIIEPINIFKFAGGWCTVISSKLLELCPIPEGLGHYGLEDTFITSACQFLKKYTNANPQQYVIRNLLVGENHRYRNDLHYTSLICPVSKKDEFRKVAQENFNRTINSWTSNTLGSIFNS